MWLSEQSIERLQDRILHIQDKLDSLSTNINQFDNDLIDADVLKERIADSGISSEEATIAINSIATADIAVAPYAVDRYTYVRSIEDIISEYKEQIRLQPMSCLNCNGAIDRDTMTCRYCGTLYRI